MELLVIRHAIAEDRDAFAATGKDDSQRPLTKRGERKMQGVAAGLVRLVGTLDAIGSSPLVRAQQTARIVADAYGSVPVSTVDALTPESDPSAFLGWLTQQPPAQAIAIVGHEPDLGALVTWLMTGQSESRVALRKGGACLIDLPDRPAAGGGTLLWALTPSQLRAVGRDA
jgi:phosphohistidine phosphatase